MVYHTSPVRSLASRLAVVIPSFLLLNGCIVVGSARLAGDVVEGAANVTLGTAGAVAGAVLPDGEKQDDDDDKRDKRKK